VGRDVQIGDHSFIGMHANVAEGVKIGSYAVISMGAVLLKDVGDEEVFMGNPARKIGNNQKHFIF
jgi:acetyltransferase-like isoleucine patch superfamily enzyme